MAAARYWRISALRTWGLGGVTISEVALYTASGRADAAATLTSRIPPAAGDVGVLQDGSAAVAVAWDAAQIAAAGWALVWEFPSATEIVSVGIGSGPDRAVYPSELRVESSLDGVTWSVLGEVAGLLYPGPHALGAVDDLRKHVLAFDFNGSSIYETYGHAVTVYGGARIANTTPLIDGTKYLDLAGGNDYLEVANAPDLDLGNSYEIGFDLYVPSGSTVGAIWHQGFYNADALTWPSPGVSIRLLDDRIRFYFYATSFSNEQFLDVPYTANTAQRWRMVRSGTDGAVWRDGAQVAARSGLGTLPAPTRPLQIGRWAFSHGTPTMVARLDNLYADAGLQLAATGAQRVQPVQVSGAAVAAASDAAQSFSAPAPAEAQLAHDAEFGGAGRIWGTTKTKGTATNVPTKARVVLLHQRSKVVAREAWSDPSTGAFAFESIDTRQEFLALAEDAAGLFRPVAANRLVPEVAP